MYHRKLAKHRYTLNNLHVYVTILFDNKITTEVRRNLFRDVRLFLDAFGILYMIYYFTLPMFHVRPIGIRVTLSAGEVRIQIIR